MDEPDWIDERHFRLGDTVFISVMGGRSDDERLAVAKPRELLDQYVQLFEREACAHIVELGVNQGGSTALVAHLAAPEKLVAIELSPDPIGPLERFIERRGLEQVVRVFYGVDQADQERLASIVATEFPDGMIDLVIDDASHLPDETLASFNVLFSRIRPGGVYVLEDWRWDHQLADFFARTLADPSAPDHERVRTAMLDAARDPAQPLHDTARRTLRAGGENPRTSWHATALAMIAEVDPDVLAGPDRTPPGTRPPGSDSLTPLITAFVLAAAWSPDVVSEIVVSPPWIAVRRGPDPLDPATFDLRDLYEDIQGLAPL